MRTLGTHASVPCPYCGNALNVTVAAKEPRLQLVGGPTYVDVVVERIECTRCGLVFEETP